MSHSLGHLILFWRVKSNLKYNKNFRERHRTGMRGLGSCSMESLHGGTLLDTRGLTLWCPGIGSLERSLDGLMLKRRMWVFLPPCSVWFNLFLSRFSGTGSLVAITAEDSFTSSIRSRCLQRKSRRRYGDHWWRCGGNVWSRCWSAKGKSKIISIA